MPMRFRKSPVGAVRLKTIVEVFGHVMPEIDFALPAAYCDQPLMTV